MLERALAAGSLTPVFQPVVRVDTLEVVAHEGLSRCAFMHGPFSILDLLDLARIEGRLAEVELHCARTICHAFAAHADTGRLLVNLSAHAVLQDALRPDDVLFALTASGLDPARVTIEVTERDVVENPARLAHAPRQRLLPCLKRIGDAHTLGREARRRRERREEKSDRASTDHGVTRSTARSSTSGSSTTEAGGVAEGIRTCMDVAPGFSRPVVRLDAPLESIAATVTGMS